MKVLIEISDHEASFGMKVLKSLSFVKKAKPIAADTLQIWEDLQEAAGEVRLHKNGSIKLRTAEEFLDEL